MKRRPRYQEVVGRIRSRILSGELPPGSRLPSEPRLMEDYGVSRTVVREAVSRLQAEGLVETHHGRGSYVLALPDTAPFRVGLGEVAGAADAVALLDFRMGVECEAAALAARAARPGDLAALRSAAAALAAAEPNEVVEADFRFHRAVAAATGNRFYRDLLDTLGPGVALVVRARMAGEHSRTDAAHVAKVRSEHEDILASVLAGDADAARAAMRIHLANTRRRLTPASA
ncbi:FadR/GntR family transcriptional regulator [Nocardiopsis mangrovi]|uniref:FadR/GntR family transcriptional regulator n=1 Tax=Nocardiopsis mangrovi TaxID=1179818 RepID=A0ABV9DS45_9ACTN